MTNLNREPIGPFAAPEHGWDGQEPTDPVIENSRRWIDEWTAISHERDRLRAENERLRAALDMVA
jgi:hypothetical protein